MFKSAKKSPAQKSGPPPQVWRQGDVFIISADEIPADAVPRRPVLAEGEVTGHAHRLDSSERAVVMGNNSGLFLRVFGDDVTVTHEEHGPVTVPRGDYIVRIQREYHPVEIRRVID